MSLQAYGTSATEQLQRSYCRKYGTFCVQSDAVDMGNGSATALGVVITDAIDDHICRCTGYIRYHEALRETALTVINGETAQ